MNHAYALKAPAQSWKIPAWVTMHNLVTAAVVAAGLLVIILLARAVSRLAKLARVAAAPVAATKASGGGGKLLLIALAAGAAIFGYAKLGHPAATTPARAAPAPSPSPQPTVTHSVVPHVVPHAAPHFNFPVHLTGGDVVALYVIAAVVAIALVGMVLRRSS